MRKVFLGFLWAVIIISVVACSSMPALPVASTAAVSTNAQVAQKVAGCVVAALPSCVTGTPIQVCAALAALQCAQGY